MLQIQAMLQQLRSAEHTDISGDYVSSVSIMQEHQLHLFSLWSITSGMRFVWQ